MPSRYVAIRDALIAKGMPEAKAKRIAAAVYIKQGKTQKARHQRAKILAADRKKKHKR